MAAINLTSSSATYDTASPKFGSGDINGGYLSAAAVLPSTGSWTAEGWVKTATTALKVAFGQSYYFFAGADASGNALAHYGGGGSSTSDITLQSTIKINDGNWHHIAVVYDAATGGKLFVDGVLGASSASLAQFNTANQFSIHEFGSNTGQYAWAGSVDEVAIWSTARYTAAFSPPTAAYTGSEVGLTHLYHLDSNGTDSFVAPTLTNIAVTSAAFHFSPANWTGDAGRNGSSYRQTLYCGAYFDFVFTAGASPTANLLLGSNANSLPISYFVNGVLQDNIATASMTSLALTGLVPNAVNTVRFYVRSSPSTSRWGGTNNLQVQGAAIDTGSTAGTAAAPAKWILFGSDSIGEGWVVDSGANNFIHSASLFLVEAMRAQGYDVGMMAATGSGFLATGNGGVPALYSISGGTYSDSASRWNKIDSGVSLLDSAGQISAYGATGTAPSAILWNFCTNDANQGVSQTDLRTSVAGVFGAYATAAAGAKIILVPGFPLDAGTVSNAAAYLLVITNGFNDAKVANPNAALTLSDFGAAFSQQIYGFAANHQDALHPTLAGNAYIAPRLQGVLTAALAPTGVATALRFANTFH